MSLLPLHIASAYFLELVLTNKMLALLIGEQLPNSNPFIPCRNSRRFYAVQDCIALGLLCTVVHFAPVLG